MNLDNKKSSKMHEKNNFVCFCANFQSISNFYKTFQTKNNDKM